MHETSRGDINASTKHLPMLGIMGVEIYSTVVAESFETHLNQETFLTFLLDATALW